MASKGSVHRIRLLFMLSRDREINRLGVSGVSRSGTQISCLTHSFCHHKRLVENATNIYWIHDVVTKDFQPQGVE